MDIIFENHEPTWALQWACDVARPALQYVTQIRSNEVNRVYWLQFDSAALILKAGPDLEREYQRLQWLQGRLPAPRAIGFTTCDGVDAILMSAIEGKDLAELKAVLPAATIIERLAEALKRVHAVDIADWPFGGTGSVLVHGDACLPNFLYAAGTLSGYIDVGDMALGEPEVDLAAAVWTLQYNLGLGHGRAFLQEYGWSDMDDDAIEELRLRYEQR